MQAGSRLEAPYRVRRRGQKLFPVLWEQFVRLLTGQAQDIQADGIDILIRFDTCAEPFC